MTDFSHLHALEQRAVNIRERMMSANNDAQWRSQSVQLFQTEQEIADERTFLGLEDLSTDDLYASLVEEQESEMVKEITVTANAAEQAAAIRTAAEALVARLELPVFTTSAQVAREVADLKAALSKGWLQRKESNPSQIRKRGGNLAECCDCGKCEFCREVLLQGESVCSFGGRL